MGFELPDALGKIIKKKQDAEYRINGFKEFSLDLKYQIAKSKMCGEITPACAAYLRWRFLDGKFEKTNCNLIEILRKEGFEEGYEESMRN